jgi:hypothetical protein
VATQPQEGEDVARSSVSRNDRIRFSIEVRALIVPNSDTVFSYLRSCFLLPILFNACTDPVNVEGRFSIGFVNLIVVQIGTMFGDYLKEQFTKASGR